MAAPLEFPHDILKYRSFQFDLAGQVISGGLSQSGLQQVVNASGGGVWTLRLEGFKLRRPEEVRAWRRIQYGGHGGVYPINVSICDLRHAPSQFYGVPHSDTSPFGDFSLYSSGRAEYVTASNAGIRATSIQVVFEDSDPPVGGEYFSLPYGEDRHSMHVITSVEPFGENYILRFVPPLRAAIPIGTPIEFDKPILTMRQSGPDSMSAALVMGKFMEPSATFIEYFE
jgi:hypothetical protein